MKLRLEENMLRLRLSADEVQQFIQSGLISYTLRLGVGNSTGQCLTYALELAPEIESKNEFPEKEMPEIQLVAEAGLITIKIPAQQARSWLNGEKTGLSAKIDVGQKIPLQIIVEKDLGYQH